MANDKSASSVYAEIGALTDWNSKLNRINEEAIDILNDIDTEIGKVEDAWVGNASKGFVESSHELIKIAKDYHTGMKDTDTFLITVANHMQDR